MTVRVAAVETSEKGMPAMDLPPVWMSASIVLVVLTVGAWWAWRAYARPLAVGLAGFAVLPAVTLAKQITWPVAVALAALVAAVVWHRWARTSATVTRWGARARRKSGVASSLDIARKASGRAMRAKATTVRPSTAELSRLRRRRMAVSDVAVQLCRVGAQWVWSSVENVVLVFGGPRMGKSAWLAGRIIDAPGAAVVTSTRTDLYGMTAELRERRGPVFVFNPAGLAGMASTITFDPLTGCADPVTATERATDMVAATVTHGAGGGDRAFWEAQARRVLAVLMHAAALGGLSMREVQDWVARPDAAREQLMVLLRRSPEPGYVEEVRQFLATNDRTRTSITSTIMPVLGWLTSPAASVAASGGHPLDVTELLASRATVFLLGAEETQTAPLVCALTGYIAREARRLAAYQPGGRLDPPLSLYLDEAALVSPVPLDRWSADMGGRGVCIIACFQSRSQLIDRYGPARAATVINNAAAKILFGGTGDRDDLDYWSTLAGDRDEPVITTDLHGRVASRTVRKVAVLAPAQVAQLPPHKVVVFAPGMSPVVGVAERAWRRADVSEVQRPDSVRVRTRLAVWRSASAVAGLTRRVVVALAMAGRWVGAPVGRWVYAQWAELVALVAAVRHRLTRRTSVEPEAAVVEPVGAEVIRFPSEWAGTTTAGEPAPLPAGDWSGDNGQSDGQRGRWN